MFVVSAARADDVGKNEDDVVVGRNKEYNCSDCDSLSFRTAGFSSLWLREYVEFLLWTALLWRQH